MSRDLFRYSEITTRLLLVGARRVRHVQPAAAITNGHPVIENVPAKLDRHLGIESFHQSIAKDVADDDVRVARAIDEITVGLYARPVEGHEAAFVAERVGVIGKPLFVFFAAQVTWARQRKGR